MADQHADGTEQPGQGGRRFGIGGDERKRDHRDQQHQIADAVERRSVAEFHKAGVDGIVFDEGQRTGKQRHQRHDLLGIGADAGQDDRGQNQQDHHQKRPHRRAGNPVHQGARFPVYRRHDPQLQFASDDVPQDVLHCPNFAQLCSELPPECNSGGIMPWVCGHFRDGLLQKCWNRPFRGAETTRNYVDLYKIPRGPGNLWPEGMIRGERITGLAGATV